MAGIFSSAIIAACVGVSSQYHDACLKAMDAGTRQAGIRQNADTAEDRTVELVDRKLKANLGHTEQEAIAVTGFVVKVVRDQRVNFRLPNFGIANSVTNEITKDTYKVDVRWDF